MKARIAGAVALLALGLAEAPAIDDSSAPIFTALPPAPTEYVTDNAQVLSEGARARLAAKLGKLRDESVFVRVYVYTLRSTNGPSAAAAAQELYRRWKMRDRELWDGLATIFVFWNEKKALVMLGQGAPSRTEDALADLSPELAAIFGDDPGGAISRVIDRIGASLVGDTASWVDSPPVPDDPGGPVYGNPPFADEADTRSTEEAVRRASTPEHPITLVLNPAKGLDTLAQRTEKLRAAWPGRVLLVVSTSDLGAMLVVPDSLKDRFSEEQRARLTHDVGVALTKATFSRTLVRVVGEVAMLAEGKTPPPWVAWKHPLKTIGGGQDEDPAPLALGIGIGLALLLVVCWFLYTLVTNPMAVLAFLVQGAIEGLIGGVFGGSGGGGFSGGGGSFGGGGASGSW